MTIRKSELKLTIKEDIICFEVQHLLSNTDTLLQNFQVDFAVDKRRKGAGPFVLSPKICISLLLRYIALWEMTTVSLSLQMNEVKQGGKSELN